MKIFVVEDSEVVRERLIELIEANASDKVVGQASTQDDAVRGIAETMPDVGIFDIELAQGNGITALQQLKRSRPDLVTIVMSNHATREHRKASTDAGADFVLDKSSEFEQIPAILESIAARSAKEAK